MSIVSPQYTLLNGAGNAEVALSRVYAISLSKFMPLNTNAYETVSGAKLDVYYDASTQNYSSKEMLSGTGLCWKQIYSFYNGSVFKIYIDNIALNAETLYPVRSYGNYLASANIPAYMSNSAVSKLHDIVDDMGYVVNITPAMIYGVSAFEGDLSEHGYADYTTPNFGPSTAFSSDSSYFIFPTSIIRTLDITSAVGTYTLLNHLPNGPNNVSRTIIGIYNAILTGDHQYYSSFMPPFKDNLSESDYTYLSQVAFGSIIKENLELPGISVNSFHYKQIFSEPPASPPEGSVSIGAQWYIMGTGLDQLYGPVMETDDIKLEQFPTITIKRSPRKQVDIICCVYVKIVENNQEKYLTMHGLYSIVGTISGATAENTITASGVVENLTKYNIMFQSSNNHQYVLKPVGDHTFIYTLRQLSLPIPGGTFTIDGKHVKTRFSTKKLRATVYKQTISYSEILDYDLYLFDQTNGIFATLDEIIKDYRLKLTSDTGYEPFILVSGIIVGEKTQEGLTKVEYHHLNIDIVLFEPAIDSPIIDIQGGSTSVKLAFSDIVSSMGGDQYNTKYLRFTSVSLELPKGTTLPSDITAKIVGDECLIEKLPGSPSTSSILSLAYPGNSSITMKIVEQTIGEIKIKVQVVFKPFKQGLLYYKHNAPIKFDFGEQLYGKPVKFINDLQIKVSPPGAPPGFIVNISETAVSIIPVESATGRFIFSFEYTLQGETITEDVSINILSNGGTVYICGNASLPGPSKGTIIIDGVERPERLGQKGDWIPLPIIGNTVLVKPYEEQIYVIGEGESIWYKCITIVFPTLLNILRFPGQTLALDPNYPPLAPEIIKSNLRANISASDVIISTPEIASKQITVKLNITDATFSEGQTIVYAYSMLANEISRISSNLTVAGINYTPSLIGYNPSGVIFTSSGEGIIYLKSGSTYTRHMLLYSLIDDTKLCREPVGSVIKMNGEIPILYENNWYTAGATTPFFSIDAYGDILLTRVSYIEFIRLNVLYKVNIFKPLSPRNIDIVIKYQELDESYKKSEIVPFKAEEFVIPGAHIVVGNDISIAYVERTFKVGKRALSITPIQEGLEIAPWTLNVYCLDDSPLVISVDALVGERSIITVAIDGLVLNVVITGYVISNGQLLVYPKTKGLMQLTGTCSIEAINGTITKDLTLNINVVEPPSRVITKVFTAPPHTLIIEDCEGITPLDSSTITANLDGNTITLVDVPANGVFNAKFIVITKTETVLLKCIGIIAPTSVIYNNSRTITITSTLDTIVEFKSIKDDIFTVEKQIGGWKLTFKMTQRILANTVLYFSVDSVLIEIPVSIEITNTVKPYIVGETVAATSSMAFVPAKFGSIEATDRYLYGKATVVGDYIFWINETTRYIINVLKEFMRLELSVGLGQRSTLALFKVATAFTYADDFINLSLDASGTITYTGLKVGKKAVHVPGQKTEITFNVYTNTLIGSFTLFINTRLTVDVEPNLQFSDGSGTAIYAGRSLTLNSIDTYVVRVGSSIFSVKPFTDAQPLLLGKPSSYSLPIIPDTIELDGNTVAIASETDQVLDKPYVQGNQLFYDTFTADTYYLKLIKGNVVYYMSIIATTSLFVAYVAPDDTYSIGDIVISCPNGHPESSDNKIGAFLTNMEILYCNEDNLFDSIDMPDGSNTYETLNAIYDFRARIISPKVDRPLTEELTIITRNEKIYKHVRVMMTINYSYRYNRTIRVPTSASINMDSFLELDKIVSHSLDGDITFDGKYLNIAGTGKLKIIYADRVRNNGVEGNVIIEIVYNCDIY